MYLGALFMKHLLIKKIIKINSIGEWGAKWSAKHMIKRSYLKCSLPKGIQQDFIPATLSQPKRIQEIKERSDHVCP
jgi:hypothetical protein